MKIFKLVRITFFASLLLSVSLTGSTPKEEKVFSESNSSQVEALSLAQKITKAADEINTENLTLDNLKGNSAAFKPAWESLLTAFETIKKTSDEYDQTSHGDADKRIIGKAESRLHSVQELVSNLLTKIENEIETGTSSRDIKGSLLNYFDTLTNDWTSNSLVIKKKFAQGVDYATIKEDLLAKLTSGEVQTKPRHAMMRGAPMKIAAPSYTTVSQSSNSASSNLNEAQALVQKIKAYLTLATQAAATITSDSITKNEDEAKKQWAKIIGSLSSAHPEIVQFAALRENEKNGELTEMGKPAQVLLNEVHEAVVGVLNMLEKQIERATGSQKASLIAIYQTWTEQWMAHPLGFADISEKIQLFLKKMNILPTAHSEGVTHDGLQLPPPDGYVVEDGIQAPPAYDH